MNEPSIHDKEYTLTQKIDHFWTYYKFYAIIAVIVIWVLVSIVVSVLTRKDVALQVMAFDTGAMLDTDIAKDFETYAGIDVKHQEVIAQMNGTLANSSDYASLAGSTKMMAGISAQELDVLMMDMENFEQNIQDGCFVDLGAVFSEEELAQFPELVRDSDGRVVGIRTEYLKGLKKYGYYQNEENAAVGIVSNSLRLDMAKKFIVFLCQD